MRLNLKFGFLFICIFLLRYSSAEIPQNKLEENIEAFAKLYGYVRWFHPSDEAQQIDWNRFACYGVKTAESAPNSEALRDSLLKLFLPIAPTLEIYNNSEKYDFNVSKITPTDTTGYKPVFWQHSGVDLGLASNKYRSIRVNRISDNNNLSKLALYQHFDATPYVNKRIKVKAAVKILGDERTKGNILLVSLPDNEAMNVCIKDENLNIKGAQWKVYEKTIEVNTKDDFVAWGCFLEGKGEMHIDELEISYWNNNKWESIQHFGFEVNDYMRKYWSRFTNEYSTKVTGENPFAGDSALCISYKGILFDKYLNFGECIKSQLTLDLLFNLPLVLLGNSSATFPQVSQPEFNNFIEQIENFESTKTDQWIADIIVYWNVIKYFSPYLSDIKCNWDKALAEALKLILTKEEKKEDFNSGLQFLMNKLEDGHGGSLDKEFKNYSLPFYAKKIDDEIVITNTKDKRFNVGDFVEKVEGKSAISLFEEYVKKVSGSKQYRDANAEWNWKRFPLSDSVNVIVKRDGNTINYKTLLIPYFDMAFSYPQIIKFSDNCTYFNMSKITANELRDNFEYDNAEKYYIFDLRWGSRNLPVYILRDSVRTFGNGQYGIVPEILKPETVSIEKLNIVSPHAIKNVNQKRMFLIDGGNISNNESFIDIIHSEGIGITLGNYTAGCCGNINQIPLPSGLNVLFTGEKYFFHDGETHYGKGLRPNILIEYEKEGTNKGKDVVLMKALEIAGLK